MGIAEILLMLAALIYLVGDDIAPRCRIQALNENDQDDR
jgi:hypothetical protein